LARSNPSRPRRRNRWRALSPEELQAQAAEQRIQAGGPGALPWQPHPTLVALQERLQLVADCWNLLDGTGGQSRQGLYLPQGRKEPEAAYLQRRAKCLAEQLLPRCPADLCRDAGLGIQSRASKGLGAYPQWRIDPANEQSTPSA